MAEWRRLIFALAALVSVMVAGTVGYLAFGFGDTRRAVPDGDDRHDRWVPGGAPALGDEQVFTIVLILIGVGTALVHPQRRHRVLLGVSSEARSRNGGWSGGSPHERTRYLCGWGRVGRTISEELDELGEEHVVVDHDASASASGPVVAGDATDDDVLEGSRARGARALVAALDDDAGNLFVTLSARSLRPDLFIVARVRTEENEEKLRRAGADRVINPQSIGGSRAAAFLLQPHVSEFLDVVMHDRDIEFRLEEIRVVKDSVLAGSNCGVSTTHTSTTRPARSCSRCEAWQASFVTNPPARDHRISAGQILIAIGTPGDLEKLQRLVTGATPWVTR